MRVFIVACLVVGIVAVGTAAVLDTFMQESSAAAFTEPGVRVEGCQAARGRPLEFCFRSHGSWMPVLGAHCTNVLNLTADPPTDL
jgi:hypothetical protein